MGHSMGASTVFQTTSRYPDLARAIILEDPPFRELVQNENPGQAQPFIGRMRQSILEYKTMPREALVEMIHKQAPSWSEEELGPWADSKLQVSLKFVEMMGNRPMPAPPWEGLSKITCPVLLITADPDKGAIITPEISQKAVCMLPSLTVVKIPGAGHNIRREAFGPYMVAVKQFLARV